LLFDENVKHPPTIMRRLAAVDEYRSLYLA